MDQTNLFYKFTGSGDTLVILHGGPGLSHHYLFPQLDSLLSDQFTLLFYDQRGSGASDGIEDTAKLTMKTFVEDLEAIRRHFKIRRFNLVGHSFGGLLAMYYGISYPDRISSMVLIDSDAASYALRTPYQIKTIRSRISPDQWAFLDSIAETPEYKNYDPRAWERYYKTFLTSYFANPQDTAFLYLGFDSLSIRKIEKTGKYVRQDLGKYDIHDSLFRLSCPALILQGDESVFSVEGAEAIQQKLRGSQLIVFEHCGHFEYIEFPGLFKSAVLNFYNER
jgi:proline iminopeptidase